MKLLFEASAPVRAPATQVRALIDDGWLVSAFLGDRNEYVDIDHKPGVVGFQGGWWYRGELSVSDDALLAYRVFNIAEQGAWAVPLANKLFVGYRRHMEERTAELARKVEAHLADAA
jgi:hypothetical protein